VNALRALVIAIALAGALLDILTFAGPARSARLGVTADGPLDTQRATTLLTVTAGAAAEHAGLRAGDVVRYASPADAVAARNENAGAIVRLRRNDGRTFVLTLAQLPLLLPTVAMLVQSIAMSALALLLALRAWHDPQARRLAIGFLFMPFLSAALDDSQRYLLAVNVMTDVLLGGGLCALVFFATGWQGTPPALVRPLRALAVLSAAVYVVANLFTDIGGWRTPIALDIAVVTWLVLVLMLIAGLAASTGRSQGVERRRISWVLATMTVALAPWIVYESFLALGWVQSLWTWVPVTTLVLPFGFGYAMLRHRLVDVGFVIDRATVLGSTTLLLAGLFGGLQWAADQLLTQATRSEGFAVQIGIAIVVLLVVRVLRARTEGFVERGFFAKRRRRIDAVRAIAAALDAIDDACGLEPFVVARLRDAGIEATVVLPGDPRLSAAEGESQLVPMRLRGRLRGGLICAPVGRDGELAPDERSALTELATAYAIAREDLEAEQLRRERGALARLTGGSGVLLGLATAPLSKE